MNVNTFYPLFSPRSLHNALRGFALLLLLSASGCASIGHEFPSGQVSALRIGETTQNDVYTTFGSPWRTGLDNGMKTWTYGDYRYSLFNDSSTEDLVIKFDKRGVVSAFTYNTTKRSK